MQDQGGQSDHAALPQEFVARWVYLASGAAIPWGRVVVQSGRIVAVDDLPASPSAIRLETGAILPALVNAHTHLEFSSLTHPLGTAGGSFARWLRDVISVRRQEAQQREVSSDILLQEKQAAIQQGEAESRLAQVRAIGEIATSAGPQEYWQQVHQANSDVQSNLHVTAFLELLGLAPDRGEALLQLAQQYLSGMPLDKSSRVVAGLSPHAPYTVGVELLRQLVACAALHNAPVAMHLAESYEELELLRSHSGELVDLLRSLGAWNAGAVPRGLVPLDLLEILANAPRSLIVHGNFLVEEEWRYIADRRERMSVVYCPRTQGYFAHGKYPLRQMLDCGVRVALGTDSRASNPNLSIWEEVQYVAQQHPQVSAQEILAAGTTAGAEALGLASDWGTLQAGTQAQMTFVEGGEAFASAKDADQALQILLQQGVLVHGR